jgi:PAS domain S-box-containing protein/putative nucleotidyltransferase with HDIG domain
MRMAAVRDITERKRAEEALIESEERFSTLAAASFEGIVISDKGRVIDCNEQLATMLGYEQSEMIGLEVNKFVAPESLAIVLKHIQSGSEEPYEHLSLRKDGTKFPVEIRAKSIPFKGRQVRVTAIWDITDRKQAEHDLLEAYDTTLKGWAKALELRDKETEDHSQRVTELTVTLAQAMGVAEKDLIHFRRGAILHDIGKMGIPDEILRKRGPLTVSEKNVVKQHPLHGLELLSPISFLEKALDIPYCHHERWDGTGYPRGLRGEEIPISARIFTVIDVWDALLSDRPYSKAWPKEKAIQYLKDESGKIFDPDCVSVFLELVEQGKI